jgi:Sulfotransferase family
MKVLSITGWCRNGSTIIGNVLNEAPDVVHVGELHFLWKNAAGKGANDRCGCGSTLPRCPIWSRILPVGRPPGVTADEWADTVVRRQRAAVRTRHTWRILRDGPRGDEIRAHARLMTEVYRAIAELTGARLIVETNKIPGETALLPHLDGVSPSYVHLVRDPRAVAHSWSRPKDYAYVMSAAKSTAYWHGFNAAARAITHAYPQRSMLLRYEDFIAEPARTVEALLRLCGMSPADNPVRDRLVELGANHTVTGNPDRFLTGPTVIRDRDDGWRRDLRARDKLAVLALSWPQFSRYGYRYRDDRRSAGEASWTSV